MAGRNERDEGRPGDMTAALPSETGQDGAPGPFVDLGDSVAWVAKAAKDQFYRFFDAAAREPQRVRHRDGRNLVAMSETVYAELVAGWRESRQPRSLADRFRAARITEPLERPNKFKQQRPRALDLVDELDKS